VHPNLPPASVRQAYYDGLPGQAGFTLSIAGWGWHSEVAIHVLRLALSGTLNRHPKLKLIIRHMGEGLSAMLARCDNVFERDVGYLCSSRFRPFGEGIAVHRFNLTRRGLLRFD
jgi:uncharacterized protein